ncbi:MAG TPA: inositol monophosphatase [Candidatus Corynebacterium gallistercoris]|uniref:Inositol-1-monophosphatase n=1 Tax=Candidatus Corynebacterium gallistercoris TaxID=2838530 RepID=A0A9D1UQB8_9CORY|nr:inositol monophosphatase [Candidatus Corynebacterium gallistercoris]
MHECGGVAEAGAVAQEEKLEKIALTAAIRAGNHIATRRRELAGRSGVVEAVATKSSAVDPVTLVDQESEDLISAILMEATPDASVVGEESGTRANGASGGELQWIVDPIDGTVNFMYGVPAYAVSIAAAVQGKVVAGVVLDVAAREAYVARTSGAARLLHVPAAATAAEHTVMKRELTLGAEGKELAQALIATGFSYQADRRQVQAGVLSELLPKVRDIRRMGSAALDLCALAAGRVDGYYEAGLNAWDFAAGALIAKRAGARVRVPDLDARSADNALVIAARGEIFDALTGAVEGGTRGEC